MRYRNAKGSNKEKEINDLLIRLNSQGERKRVDGNTYSNSTQIAQKTIFKGISKFAALHGVKDRLNINFNPKFMEAFFDYKIDTAQWDLETAYSRVAIISSMTRGLLEAGIRVNLRAEFFSKLREKIDKLEASRDEPKDRKNRYIKPDVLDRLTKDMHNKGSEYGIYIDIAKATGLRDAEIQKLMTDFKKYVKVHGDIHKIEKLPGKNRKLYDSKIITAQLAQRLVKNDGITPEHNALHQTMGENSPHDVRFTFARDSYDAKMAQGMSQKDALLAVSKELNHNRASITKYYLARSIS